MLKSSDMRQKTALESIAFFIKEKNIVQMRKWSCRKLYSKDGQLMRYARKMVNNIRSILKLISGDDICEMLKGNALVQLESKN